MAERRDLSMDIVDDLQVRVWRAIKGAVSEKLYAVVMHPNDLAHLNYLKYEVDGYGDMSTFVTHIHDLLIVTSSKDVCTGELMFLTEEEYQWNVAEGNIHVHVASEKKED